jgi:hypothetical protein
MRAKFLLQPKMPFPRHSSEVTAVIEEFGDSNDVLRKIALVTGCTLVGRRIADYFGQLA